MTDTPTCPHCGAERDNDRSGIWFDCGSGVVCDHPVNSTLCELRTLRKQVAAQQELLKEVTMCGCSWISNGKYAEMQIPLDLIEMINKAVSQ